MDQPPEEGYDGQVGAPSALEASLALDGDGSRIAHARRLAADFLTLVRDAHGIPVLTATVEIVQLIVSELVTNARKHAPRPALLNLRVTDGALHIELWDSNPVLPAPKAPDPNGLASTAWKSSRPWPSPSASKQRRSANASPPPSPSAQPETSFRIGRSSQMGRAGHGRGARTPMRTEFDHS
ncbi:ATP-binding protein [Streptomyces sp. NPDC005345]|uniref:ATP-binding protein n=1 Tax=Streptomyces sp. NPDC005345 TaxID=3156877 RepID=UPI0033B7FB8C